MLLDSPWWAALYGLIGLFVGSFLNVAIDRVPRHEPILAGRSRCESCGTTLSAAELVPVASYLALRGRCRTCGAPIPFRILVVEALTGALFGLIWLRFGLSVELLVATLYGSALVVIFFIDLEHRIVPNRLVYPLSAFRLVEVWITGASPWPYYLGGLVGLLVMGVITFAYPAGMGMGDVKLMGLIGLVVGFPQVLVVLFLSFILGGLGAAFLLATRLRGRKDAIPFAPYIVTASLATIFWGEVFLRWYGL